MIFGPLPIFDLPGCMDIRRQAYNAHLRRKAQETIGKEETMPTLLEDLDYFLEQTLETTPRFLCEPAYKRLRAFIEANTPWLPPRQEGFGPWIEYWPGDPGPRVNDEVLVLSEIESKKKYAPKVRGLARDVAWENTGRSAIIAYCVKLPEAE